MKDNSSHKMDPFPRNLRALRAYHAMSTKDLAQKIGVSGTAVSMYENGYRLPKLEILIAIADALETSIDVLVGHEVKEDTRKAIELNRRKEDYKKIAKELGKLMEKFADSEGSAGFYALAGGK